MSTVNRSLGIFYVLNSNDDSMSECVLNIPEAAFDKGIVVATPVIHETKFDIP
jgi:hypothetical protein